MEEQPFSAVYEADNSILVISGEVDETSGVTLREAIESHSADFSRDLTVNLSRVDFLPSLAVGVLAVAMTSAERSGVKLVLVAVQGCIAQRVLEICALPYREE